MKAIIFGIGGQDGFYLKMALEKLKITVVGCSRNDGYWIKGDVKSYSFVNQFILEHQPDLIFHLAANSTTRHEALFENHETISTGTLNILESVYQNSKKTKVFITGSGVQFKNNLQPIKEDHQFEGNSAYSVSRIQSVYAARYYRSLGINTYVGYLFHHESPFRKPHHLSKIITEYLKNLKIDSPKLIIGDSSVKKEWAFAEDIAEGIITLVKQEQIHEACIGTGVAYSIEDWLKECFSLKGLDYREYVIGLEEKFKPEYSLLVSNPETIQKLGWNPKTSFKELAVIMCR